MLIKNIAYNNLIDLNFEIVKASGSYLYTKNGQKILDFTSGWNVANLGWNNPEIATSLVEQITSNNINIPYWCNSKIQNEYAEYLLSKFPPNINTIIKATTGTEAIEMAVKLARVYTSRKKVIGFKHAYHGHSFMAMSLGFDNELTKEISPMVPQFKRIEFPNIISGLSSEKEVLKKFEIALKSTLIKKDVAAIVLEPEMITGWGSCKIAPKGFLPLVRKLTREYGTMMIVDEVGTGFSRLGKLFGIDISSVSPDVVVLAKASANGTAAIASVLTDKELAQSTIDSANYTSTFCWGNLACAAAKKTLEIHERDKTAENSQIIGSSIKKQLLDGLNNIRGHATVAGIGMEIGIHLTDTQVEKKENLVKTIVQTCFHNGLHIVDGTEGNIQLMPPLTLNLEEAKYGVEILIESIQSQYQG